MKNKKVRKLWEVEANNSKRHTLPEGNLLVIAPNATKAAVKATKWMQRNKYFNFRIVKINYLGEIDIF